MIFLIVTRDEVCDVHRLERHPGGVRLQQLAQREVLRLVLPVRGRTYVGKGGGAEGGDTH